MCSLCATASYFYVFISQRNGFISGSFSLFYPFFFSPSSECVNRIVLMARAFSLTLEFLSHITSGLAYKWQISLPQSQKTGFVFEKRDSICVFTGWSFKCNHKSIRFGTWNYWTMTYCFVSPQCVFMSGCECVRFIAENLFFQRSLKQVAQLRASQTEESYWQSF